MATACRRIRDFGDAAAAGGWTPATGVAVLLDYVHAQDSDDALLDFLGERLREEDETGDEDDDPCGVAADEEEA